MAIKKQQKMFFFSASLVRDGQIIFRSIKILNKTTLRGLGLLHRGDLHGGGEGTVQLDQQRGHEECLLALSLPTVRQALFPSVPHIIHYSLPVFLFLSPCKNLSFFFQHNQTAFCYVYFEDCLSRYLTPFLSVWCLCLSAFSLFLSVRMCLFFFYPIRPSVSCYVFFGDLVITLPIFPSHYLTRSLSV